MIPFRGKFLFLKIELKAQGVYPTQDTTNMGTRVEQDEGDKNNSKSVAINLKERSVGTMRVKVPNKT